MVAGYQQAPGNRRVANGGGGATGALGATGFARARWLAGSPRAYATQVKQIPIADDHVVTIHYRLTLDDGTIADESFGQDPLVYLHGHGNIVPGLERQLVGKQAGDTVAAEVLPAEGYGDFDPAAEQTVPRTAFPPNMQIGVGMQFQAQGRGGRPQMVWIKSVSGDQVTVTGNHPLAGQRLNFHVEVQSVRRATPDELKHGHVHGPGGHHH